ncbi:MAG: hemolysin family protein [Myxococcota bacterium]|nr:hemolysin family protein [Myxococcota bacterium]
MIGELGIAIPLAAICVLVSAFCSGTEVALFSLRRVDRDQLSRSELWVDKQILKVLERPRRLIATVLIGNQAFNSLLAVIVLAVVIRWQPVDGGVAAWWAIGGIALAIALPLIVLISEVTSKTLAAKMPLFWARVCVAPLSLFAVIVTPIRVVLQTMTEIVLRPLGEKVRTRPARDLSQEEFRSLLDAGSAQGQVDASERRLIHRVFEFSDKNVGQVMTPRERIFALSYDLSMQRMMKEIAGRGFSRVPIYQKSLDNVRGILNAKDLVRTAAGQPLGRPLVELLHEPLFVPRTTPIKRLFLTFKQKKVHMAIVVSEYGKVLGLVTMDDLLSQIFGVLRDERAEMQSQPPGRNRVRTPVAGAPTDPANPELETGPVPRNDLDTGPVIRPTPPALDPPDGIVAGRADTDLSGRIDRPDSQPGDGGGVLDPPAPSSSGVRPIYPVDEVTPPAVDIDELAREHQAPKR